MNNLPITDTNFFTAQMQCPRIHMRNAYQITIIAQTLQLEIEMENMKSSRRVNVTDVISLMLLKLCEGDNVGFHLTGDSSCFPKAKAMLEDVLAS